VLEANNILAAKQAEVLRAEAVSLESQKREVEAQKQLLHDDRRILDGDRERHDLEQLRFDKALHAAALAEHLVKDAVSGRISLKFVGDELAVSPLGNDSSYQPTVYSAEKLPPWMPGIVDRFLKLDNAVKQVKAAEIELQAFRTQLAALHPELEPKIAEQRKQDPISAQRMLQQLLSDGQGRGE